MRRLLAVTFGMALLAALVLPAFADPPAPALGPISVTTTATTTVGPVLGASSCVLRVSAIGGGASLSIKTSADKAASFQAIGNGTTPVTSTGVYDYTLGTRQYFQVVQTVSNGTATYYPSCSGATPLTTTVTIVGTVTINLGASPTPLPVTTPAPQASILVNQGTSPFVVTTPPPFVPANPLPVTTPAPVTDSAATGSLSGTGAITLSGLNGVATTTLTTTGTWSATAQIRVSSNPSCSDGTTGFTNIYYLAPASGIQQASAGFTGNITAGQIPTAGEKCVQVNISNWVSGTMTVFLNGSAGAPPPGGTTNANQSNPAGKTFANAWPVSPIDANLTGTVAAGTGTTVIKNSLGWLSRIVITTAGTTGNATCYDNASTGSGTVLAVVPGTTGNAAAAIGDVIPVGAPAANGITCVGAANSPAFTVIYW